MTRSRSAALTLGAIGLALLLPVSAGAATRTVTMGTTVAQGKKLNSTGSDVNAFFPRATRIHVGDKVKFTLPNGFHTFEFPKPGANPVDLVVPDGKTIAGINDAAGQPFWFNGQPELNFNLSLAAKPLFGKTVSYNGKKRVESGVSVAPGAVKPVKVRFTRAGTFKYFCNVHPGMTGQIAVVAKRKKIPSAAANRKVVKRQFASALKVAKGLSKATVPAGTVDVGEAGKKGVEFYGMLPAKLPVHVGDTVTFRMTPGSRENHTATTGPGNPETEPNSYLGQIAASFQGVQIDQRAIYPSEAPGTTGSLTPALHGNGFWGTGALDSVAGTPLPDHNAVLFGAPGTYHFYCMIHPFMSMEVDVT
jgi:plastocyanin